VGDLLLIRVSSNVVFFVGTRCIVLCTIQFRRCRLLHHFFSNPTKQNNGWLTVGCLTPSRKYVIHIQDENIWKAYRNEGGTEHTEMREEQNIQKWGRNITYRNEGGTEHTEMREEQNIQKWVRNRTYRNEGGTEHTEMREERNYQDKFWLPLRTV
jgi:hypothetical protein